MIEKLHAVATKVAAAPSLDEALHEVVTGSRAALACDACAVYLIDASDDYLVLADTDGLDRSAIGNVRLAPGEGVMGLVRERREAVHLEDAASHPRFKPFPLTQEQTYSAFLGAPMIHHGNVVGVLAIWRVAGTGFNLHDEAFLGTAAILLCAALMDTTALMYNEHARDRSDGFLFGIAGAPGVATGEVVLLSPITKLSDVPDRVALDPALEQAAFLEAVIQVQKQILHKTESLKSILPSELHALFEVHSMLAGDKWLKSRVSALIQGGSWASAALRDAISELSEEFQRLPDERFRAKSEDIRAVGQLLLSQLNSEQREPREYPLRTVLIGEEISLAQISEIPRDRLAAIVCIAGSGFSHTAVFATALGIPAVMGVSDLAGCNLPGMTMVVDGYVGRVMIQPNDVVRDEFLRLEGEERELSNELLELRHEGAVTLDGTTVSLQINAATLPDMELGTQVGAAGVGLYRSEFPFMLRESFPTEPEQYDTYYRILSSFAPKPVTMRTLDIGGDKQLPYFPIGQTNGLLGWRGIRITLHHPQIMLVQMKAMLRAHAEFGNLRILLPMVTGVNEVREANRLIEEALQSLQREGIIAEKPPVGIMLEIPVGIFNIKALVREADFLSIGSNDLTQYLVAADRDNPKVAHLYNQFDPGVLRAIQYIVERSLPYGKPVSICGELAGDPRGAYLLTAMGLRDLSMAPSRLLRIRKLVQNISIERARSVLEAALELEDGIAVREFMLTVLEDAGLGGLSRAGR
ncbi:MAG: phosphotransferase system enzyme I (PtsP) [Gammaproteobacteria bacterium]|jgi:phosphotransferase system enzyme I (PtsP)